MNLTSKPIRMNQEVTAAETLTTLCRSPTTSPLALPTVDQAQIPVMPALPLPIHQEKTMKVKTMISPIPTAPILLEQPKAQPNTIKCQKTFPQKLFEILETPEHSDILKWLPGGKAFIVVDKKRFATKQLPAYLKQTQYTSFTRKLCRWKFIRVSRGPFMGAYHHKLFRRDHPALCKLMSCNDEVPRLAVIDQTRQQAINSITSSPRPNNMGLSVPQQNALQVLEEVNRVSIIKEQLLNIRLKRAQLYDQQQQQKRILRHAEASRTVSGPQARQYSISNQSSYDQQVQIHHPQLHRMNGSSPSNSSKILQDACSALKSGNTIEYNVHMSQLAKLRQTGMLNRIAATRTY